MMWGQVASLIRVKVVRSWWEFEQRTTPRCGRKAGVFAIPKLQLLWARQAIGHYEAGAAVNLDGGSMYKGFMRVSALACFMSLAASGPGVAQSTLSALNTGPRLGGTALPQAASPRGPVYGCAVSRSAQSDLTDAAFLSAQGDPNGFILSSISLTDIVVREEGGNVQIENGGPLGPSFEKIERSLSRYTKNADGSARRADLATLQAIALEAQCQLRSGGYALTSVRILPQDLSRDGAEVKFAVIRGQVTGVSFSYRGGQFDVTTQNGRIQPVALGPETADWTTLKPSERRAITAVMAHFETLLEAGPASDDMFERAVLLAQRVPGVHIRPQISADGNVPGQLQLNVLIDELDTLSADFAVMNYSPESLEPWGILGSLNFNNRFLAGDQLSLSAYSSTDFSTQWVTELGYKVPIWQTGWDWKLYGSYGESNPGSALIQLDLATSAQVIGTELSYPLLVRQTRTMDVSLGLQVIDQDIQIFGNSLSNDKLTVAYARANGTFTGPFGFLNAYELEFRKGLDGPFSPSKPGDLNVSRIGANPQAGVLKFRSEHQRALGKTFTFNARLAGQTTNNPLLAHEEYIVGNYTIGRGYSPGALTGDKALGASFELLTGPYMPFHSAGAQDKPGFIGGTSVRPFVFYDINAVWNEDRFAEPHRFVNSKGIGLRSNFPSNLSLDLTYAYATQKASAFDSKPPYSTILVQLRKRF